MTPPRTSKELRGIGGWLAVFFTQMVLTTGALVVGLTSILVQTNFTFETWKSALSIGAIAVTCFTLIVALLLMARLRPSGVALAERALILTFLATVHLSVMHSVADVPFLEVLLFGTGSLLIWIMYLGLGTRIRGQAYHIDFSRRMANTYAPEKRFLRPTVRWLYNLLIAAYLYFIASLLWALMHVSV